MSLRPYELRREMLKTLTDTCDVRWVSYERQPEGSDAGSWATAATLPRRVAPVSGCEQAGGAFERAQDIGIQLGIADTALVE